MPQVEEVVRRFVERINAHDVPGMLAMMSTDHVFTDGLGASVAGKERLTEAWQTYFRWMPDFHIAVFQSLQRDNMVALFGTASGTFAVQGQLLPENHWRIPAAWRALVRDGTVAAWQVYCDNKPVYDIMARCPPSSH
jgi:hypothetical protein